jgi:TRAP-type C4-dicarboxylate transport system permease small subunit
VLIDTPAWIAHSIMPIAFALIAYRFLISSLKRAGESVLSGKTEAST